MSDDYLWNGTGEPDPEIVKLETLLARYRYAGRKRRPRNSRLAIFSVAAAVFIAAAVAFMMRPAAWSVWQIAGKRIAVGQTVETGAQNGAKIEAEEIGEVQLDPNSRLQILQSKGENQQFALRRGTMHALIWAPPSRFVVDTPSAKTIDLGCAYTLTVLTDNTGLLTVQTGWVAFQAGKRESFIPAGAACRTRPRLGPGLPYFEDSSAAFRDAVSNFDKTGAQEELRTIVRDARKDDALTLWHLIVRTSGSDRNLVVQRFAALIPGADIPGLLAGNSGAIDQAWNLLGLGGTDWWRMWKHQWQT
jgi:ferric-dicitrate binding protein FerR (iron transport regulator)